MLFQLTIAWLLLFSSLPFPSGTGKSRKLGDKLSLVRSKASKCRGWIPSSTSTFKNSSCGNLPFPPHSFFMLPPPPHPNFWQCSKVAHLFGKESFPSQEILLVKALLPHSLTRVRPQHLQPKGCRGGIVCQLFHCCPFMGC